MPPTREEVARALAQLKRELESPEMAQAMREAEQEAKMRPSDRAWVAYTQTLAHAQRVLKRAGLWREHCYDTEREQIELARQIEAREAEHA